MHFFFSFLLDSYISTSTFTSVYDKTTNRILKYISIITGRHKVVSLYDVKVKSGSAFFVELLISLVHPNDFSTQRSFAQRKREIERDQLSN